MSCHISSVVTILLSIPFLTLSLHDALPIFSLLADDAEEAARFLEARPHQLSFEQPPEIRVGFWGAPHAQLRIELDLAYAAWSEADNSIVRLRPPEICDNTLCPIFLDRHWKDTVSVRLGVEGDISRKAVLSGGVAYEPSPVRSSQLEPGFPRGDAYIYALGWSYSFSQFSVDLGYSLHDHDA